jgi:tetratricopeptide (TPR) repeat protein
MSAFDALHHEGMAALARGDWMRASAIGARLLSLAPEAGAAHFIAGVAASRTGNQETAIAHFQRACAADGQNPAPWVELARSYVTEGRVPEAIQAADAAMALSPSDGALLDTLGVIYGRANFHDRALSAFAAAVDRAPDSGASRFNLASALAFAGDIERAEVEFEACLRIDPTQWRAYFFLSQLRRQTPERNHISRWQDIVRTAWGQLPRLYVNMALGKEHEDLGDYDAAFRHFTAGKRAGGEGRGYDSAQDAELMASVARCFPDALPHQDGDPSEEPIFVIGMPRTGTTLIDRILSSHPMVHSSGELRNFLVALHRAIGAPSRFLSDPDLPHRLTGVDWAALGRAYIQSTRPGTGHVPRFVDKLPHNFLVAGFIARALPNARIVCLRRNPLDTCLSNFRQIFALESPYYDYSFDLLDTGRYFVGFDRLMAHWKRVLPGRILEIGYEDLVERQEEKTRELLAFCGLSFDPACLSFERNVAPVATASVVQVRSAMYRSALDRWKRYDAHLDGLRSLFAQNDIAVE